MTWLQLVLCAPSEEAETISTLLETYGSVAVTMQDAAGEEIFEPLPGEAPLWKQTRVIGLFDPDIDITGVIDKLENELSPRELPSYEVKTLANQDWERIWLESFKPMKFGSRLWIIPTAYDPVKSDAINLSLDPGLAFGTGTHPTTALCLQWLDKQDLRLQHVIDYGCGSGVLGIAAALLGAKSVFAIDIDPQALIATTRNADANKVSDKIRSGMPNELATKPVDLILANILANPLIDLSKTIASHVKPGGHIVLSGILAQQKDEVLSAYNPWMTESQVAMQDNWVMINGMRNSKRP